MPAAMGRGMAHTRKPARRRTKDDDPNGRYSSKRRKRSSGVSFASCVTKYPGKCQRCGEDVPIGTHVRCLLGTGRIWHVKASCWAGADKSVESAGAALKDSDIPAYRSAPNAADLANEVF